MHNRFRKLTTLPLATYVLMLFLTILFIAIWLYAYRSKSDIDFVKVQKIKEGMLLRDVMSLLGPPRNSCKHNDSTCDIPIALPSFKHHRLYRWIECKKFVILVHSITNNDVERVRELFAFTYKEHIGWSLVYEIKYDAPN